MGRLYAREVASRSRIITDPVITAYVKTLGQRLARNSGAAGPFTFTIIDSNEVNAFAAPGAFVFLNAGLIGAADNEAELAGVLAHEIAHVAACHAAQEMAREDLTDVSSVPRFLRMATRALTINTVYATPARSFEGEADSLGLQYMYKAGYDPHALASFLERVRTLKEDAGKRPDAPDIAQISDRVQSIHRQTNALFPAVAAYKTDTDAFQNIKKRLAAMSPPEPEAGSSGTKP